MDKPVFYQAVLKPVNDNELKQILKGQSLTDRMGTEEAKCPTCGTNHWMLLPPQSVAVMEGGKPYMECLGCGYTTHL